MAMLKKLTEGWNYFNIYAYTNLERICKKNSFRIAILHYFMVFSFDVKDQLKRD